MDQAQALTGYPQESNEQDNEHHRQNAVYSHKRFHLASPYTQEKEPSPLAAECVASSQAPLEGSSKHVTSDEGCTHERVNYAQDSSVR